MNPDIRNQGLGGDASLATNQPFSWNLKGKNSILQVSWSLLKAGRQSLGQDSRPFQHTHGNLMRHHYSTTPLRLFLTLELRKEDVGFVKHPLFGVCACLTHREWKHEIFSYSSSRKHRKWWPNSATISQLLKIGGCRSAHWSGKAEGSMSQGCTNSEPKKSLNNEHCF